MLILALACADPDPTAPATSSTAAFTVDDWVAATGGPHDAVLAWTNGGEVGATVELAPDGDAERTVDALRVPVLLAFRTDDGVFDEAWSAVLRVDAVDEAWFHAAVPLDELGGTYTARVTGPADPDPGVTFDGRVVGGVTTGIVRERPGIAEATASRTTTLPTQTATVATWR